MTIYETIPFDLVHNINSFRFYKILINGKCLLDEFIKAVEGTNDEYAFAGIIAIMDNFGKAMLHKPKFRQIKNTGRKDVYEFKKKEIRVYVIVQNTNVYVALGGKKKTQPKDIERIKNRFGEFPENFENFNNN